MTPAWGEVCPPKTRSPQSPAKASTPATAPPRRTQAKANRRARASSAPAIKSPSTRKSTPKSTRSTSKSTTARGGTEMRTMRRALALAVLALAALVPAAQAASPAWSVAITPLPSNLVPGANPKPQYLISATNVGAAPSAGNVVLKALLPTGLVASNASAGNNDKANTAPPTCTPTGGEESQEVKCETDKTIAPGHLIQIQVSVAVNALPGIYATEAIASGGGAEEVKATVPAVVQVERLGFGFLPGFAAPATGEDGEAETDRKSTRLNSSHSSISYA